MKKKRRNPKAAQAAHDTVQAREDDRGTPETRLKARYDVVQALAARRRLTKPEMAAVGEIQRIDEALGRCIFPAREMDAAIRGNGGSYRAPISYLDRMSDDEILIYEKHYMPWKSAMAKVQYLGCPVNVLTVCIAIVWDNLGLEAVEARFNMKSRTALGILKFGLGEYARVAGL